MGPKKATNKKATPAAPAPAAEEPAPADAAPAEAQPSTSTVKKPAAKRRNESSLLEIVNPKFNLPSSSAKRSAASTPKNYNLGKVAPAKTKGKKKSATKNADGAKIAKTAKKTTKKAKK